MRRQAGVSGLSILMFAIALSLIYLFLYAPYQKNQAIQELRNAELPVSIEDKQIIDAFRSRTKPDVVLQGAYRGSVEVSGRTFGFSYLFSDDGSLTKELSQGDGILFAGTAKYQFDGSTLVFSSVSGDSALFPDIGQAIEVHSKDSLTLHSADGPITLKSDELIAIEREATETALAERVAELESASYFDLSVEAALEKLSQEKWPVYTIPFIIALLVMFVVFQRLNRMKRHGF